MKAWVALTRVQVLMLRESLDSPGTYQEIQVCVTWLIGMCDMTHWYVCHNLLICVPWLVRMCVMTGASINVARVPRLPWFLSGNSGMYDIGMCDMTYDSFICVAWLIYMCAMTRASINVACVASFDSPGSHQEIQVCMTWLIGMCGMTHWYVCHDSCKY